MMELSNTYLPLILGLAIGILASWFAFRSKIQYVSELKTSVQEAGVEIAKLREENKTEAEKRSAAEEKSKRIPELELELNSKEKHTAELQNKIVDLSSQISKLDILLKEEKKATEDKLNLLNKAEQAFTDTFKVLSSEALKGNNQQFMQIAKNALESFHINAKGDLDLRQKSINDLVKPLKDSLEKVDSKLQELEITRTKAYSNLDHQLKALATTQAHLDIQTSNLVKALSTPTVRGRWGEIQLKRVVEICGMVEKCDFVVQESIHTESGRLRPDMVIKLPNNKEIVVDSKVPLKAYLEAIEASDDSVKQERLKEHAKQVRTHLSQLGNKAYWNQFKHTPEFVVLFLPGESFFSSALEQDPNLIEFGVNQNVILATPTTLISLLRAVAIGWRENTIAANTQQIRDLGQELYKRMSLFVTYFSEIKRHLDNTIEAHNKAVGSLEGRVLVSVRRFKELGASTGDEIGLLNSIDKSARVIHAPDFIATSLDL